MPNTYLGLPFDAELFMRQWNAEPDPVLTALLNSGAVAEDALVASRLTNEGSDLYTVPFYNTLGGTPVNYDGQTDIPSDLVTGDYMTGVAFGRAKAWTDLDFQSDISGNDPMQHIVGTVARYWAKQRQNTLLKILSGVFSIKDDANWGKHIIDTGDVMGPTTVNNAATDALGDNKSVLTLAFMHSNVARELENIEILEYWKYTDANGVQRNTNLASANGMTVVVDDNMPHTGDKYTTFLLGSGFIRHAPARLKVPVEPWRDPKTAGGQELLYTRKRETFHPNGFSFIVPKKDYTHSPTDAQLASPDNWARGFDAKAIPAVAVVTTSTSAKAPVL